MMRRKAYEGIKETPSMCRVGRSRREKYEGRGKKRCGAARTNETRKLYERPRWKVDGNGDQHDRGLSQNQADRTLKISQASSAKKSKLIRFLRQFISQGSDHLTYIRQSDGAPKPDGALKDAARSKILHYRRLYLDHPDQLFSYLYWWTLRDVTSCMMTSSACFSCTLIVRHLPMNLPMNFCDRSSRQGRPIVFE